MKHNLRIRCLRLLCLLVITGWMVTAAAPVQACPMCKIAHEDATDPAVKARPRAYMMSILFMLAMPASICTTFGVTFYRLSRKQQQLNQIALDEAKLANPDYLSPLP